MKSICIIGMGQFGGHLAKYLSKNGIKVIALDSSKSKINEINEHVTHAFIGDARDKEVLETVIPKEIDAVVVSLGGEIEHSILCTLHLTEMGISKIIVKAISDDHANILKALGAHEVVFPERDMAERTGTNLIKRKMADILPLTDEYSIKDIDPLPEFIGKNIIELDLRKMYHIYVIALKNKNNHDDIVILPYINTTIEKHHILTVVGKDSDINNLVYGEKS